MNSLPNVSAAETADLRDVCARLSRGQFVARLVDWLKVIEWWTLACPKLNGGGLNEDN